MNIESYQNPYTAAEAQPADRATFIRNTYMHVALAVGALVAFESIFLKTALAQAMSVKMLSGGALGWLLVLGLFMVVSHIANRWASSDTSSGLQYAGLGLFVIAQGIILAPLLLMAQSMETVMGDSLIAKAALVTGGLFLGLTAIVLLTRKYFSFIKSIVSIRFFVALGTIIAGAIFGFQLGTFFSAAMVLLLSGSIIYSTSNVMHHYRTTQHVAAALALFSSLATLFWYVLQLFMSFSND